MVVPERSARRVVRFGVFEVDLRAGELFKQGIKIKLQQQPFRVLALLLEHPGEVVTREDLRQAIWPAGTFVEFDVGLDAAIHKLRSALGDSAENPRLVETLPRRGYRLIVAEAPPEHPSTAGRRRVAVATIIGAIALGSIAGLWHPWSRHTANSVAVLYFSARDTADAYLADGLTEDLTSLLGSVTTVRVKSPGVVRRAQRASPGDTPAIARALGVHYLVDGNVRRVGTRVRVSIRLLTGATAVADWGDVFDRSPDELLALPSEIARAVALHVGGPAPSSETRALGTLRTRSPAAYDHYLRGNFFLARRSPDQTARAVAEYREAERLDSGFAAAIGRAAYAHAIARGNYYRLPDAPIESLAVRGLGIAHRHECRQDEPMVGPPRPVRNQRPSSGAVSRAGEDGGEHAFHHHVPGLQPVGQLSVLPGSGHVAPPEARQRPPPARERRGGVESDSAVGQSHRERAIAHVRPRGQINEGDRAPRIERERQVLLPVGLVVPPKPAQDRAVLMVRLRVLGVEGDGPLERFHRALHGPGVDEGQKEATRSEERRVGKECRSRWSPYH